MQDPVLADADGRGNDCGVWTPPGAGGIKLGGTSLSNRRSGRNRIDKNHASARSRRGLEQAEGSSYAGLKGPAISSKERESLENQEPSSRVLQSRGASVPRRA